MAVAGINNVSVLESSYLGESHSSASRKWVNQERPITRTSFIRKMWRELEGENSYRVIERQQPSGMANGTMGSQCSCSSGGSDSECAMVNTSEVENECPRDQNQMGLHNGQEDNGNFCLQRSPALDVAYKQRVRQVFREWGSKNSSGHALSGPHTNSSSRAKCIRENECKRVRTVRRWLESNTQEAETGHSDIEELPPENGHQIDRDGLVVNHIGVGAQRSIRRLYGRQVLLDLLTRFERERKKEMQILLENRPVSTFAHRNRIQSLLKGRFLWNQRFVHDEKSTSIAESELGILRQTQTVSDLRKEILSRLDNHEHTHDGIQSDASSDNGMIYQEENIEEPPDDIVNGVETNDTRIDVNETHKVDSETDTCGSPQEYAASVGVRRERVLEEDGWQRVTPIEFIENRDQNREGSVERNYNVHHIEISERTLELVSTIQGPPVSPSTIQDDQCQSNGDELEVHEAFDPSETNADSLSWHEGSAEAEGWREPLIEDDDGIEWRPLTNTESNEGLDANSIENEDEWYQETAGSDYQESHDGWFDNAIEDTATESWFGATSYLEAPSVVRTDVFYASDDGNNRLELRELMSRRSVSNLLQSDFRVRLDQLMQSYVERQDQAFESDDEWMVEREHQDQDQHSVDENDNVNERTEGAHSSPPAISQTHQDDTFLDLPGWQHHGTEWEIINGLRTDMITLQERMNSMQRTLETCMNMQFELQRSVQQEVSSALNRSSTSGKDSLQKDQPEVNCFLCCDNSSDSSPNRSGDVLVCSKCAEKINWSKLKESVRHP